MPQHHFQNHQSDRPDDLFPRRVIIALALAALFVAGFLWIAYAPATVFLTFASVWFGCVLRHAALWLARKTPLSERWATTVAVVLLLVFSLGFLVLLGLRITLRINELAENIQIALVNLLNEIETRFPGIHHFLETTSPRQAAEMVMGGATGSSLAAWLTSPVGLVINVLIIFFTGIYFATSSGVYRDGLVSLFPKKRQERLRSVFDEIGDALWQWTLARLVSMAIVGVLSWIGLALLNIPLAATLGVLTGLIVFIPNIGPLISVIPPLLLSFSQGPWTPLYVLLLYGGIQLVETWFITPFIHQKENHLPAALVIIVQLVAAMLFGLLAIVFTMPITLAAKIAVERLYLGRGG